MGHGDPGHDGRPAYHKNPVLSVLEAMFVHAGWLHLLVFGFLAGMLAGLLPRAGRAGPRAA